MSCAANVRDVEAKLNQSANGLLPEGEGWFVLNAQQARWKDAGPFGFYCAFEGADRFPQVGINISVLQPGQSLGRYHREPGHQEDFLVLAGQCVLIVEEETRDLGPWDFFHCPPNTAHTVVGAGETPSVVLAVGRRGSGDGAFRGVVYPRSEIAAEFGVSVQRETGKPDEAYADVPAATPVPYRSGWLPSLE